MSYTRWSLRETKLLRDMSSDGLALQQMSEEMSRSVESVRRKLIRINLKPPGSVGRFWSEDDNEHLRSLFGQGLTDYQIASIMNRTVFSIEKRRRVLKLKRRPLRRDNGDDCGGQAERR